MKNLRFAILICLLFSTPLMAQDLGDIMDMAKDAFGDSQQTAEDDADNKALEDLKKKFGEYTKGLDSLDMYSSELKCIYLMVKYAFNYEEIKEETRNTALCKEKYDLYGMQLMAITSSTTIMFCTEELFNMGTNGRGLADMDLSESPEYMEVIDEYIGILSDSEGLPNADLYGFSGIHNDFKKTLITYAILKPDYIEGNGNNFLDRNTPEFRASLADRVFDLLMEYFHPLTIISETVDIGKKMKALPCSDGRSK